MTKEQWSEDDQALDEALQALPEPELPPELARKLDAIPSRGVVRRFPGRAVRASAFVWAAAAAIGLFLGAHWAADEATESASAESSLGDPSQETEVGLTGDASGDDEDLALAVGSFTEFEEEP